MPWASRTSTLYSSPRSFVFKLALGEAPEHIPTVRDARVGAARLPSRTGVLAVDRVIAHYADGCRVARVHDAAGAAAPGTRHNGYDDVEQAVGLARTFRVDTERGAPIAHIVAALRSLTPVEEASPQYLSMAPFEAAAAEAEPDAWQPRDLVNAAEAMAYEAGDPAVIVAFLDTGVMETHGELANHLRAGLDTVQLTPGDVAAGARLLGDESGVDDDPADEVGHGTSCTAIVGAIGQSIPPGLGGACGLLPIRVLGAAELPGRPHPVGVGAISDIDCGMKRAVDLGARVLNMSFGTPLAGLDPSDPVPHADVVRYALARGCVLVAASGNSGQEEAYAPAALAGVIAVSAVGADGLPCAFATSGPHVALAAPGERVLTATLDGYGRVTGTSFAAPFVTAAAALCVSRGARRAYPVDAQTAKRVLTESAQAWPAGKGAGHGAGVLDAHAALRLLDQEMDRAPPPQAEVVRGSLNNGRPGSDGKDG
jgi:subtilisin family serine protease